MSKQIFYEDIEVSVEVKPLAKIATTAMLVKWAGATGDFYPLHYDEAFARANGVDRPIVHGSLKGAWLAQLMTDWVGEEGVLKRLAFYLIKMDYPRHMKTIFDPEEGETWWCKGKVTKKYEQDTEHYVDCDIWVENGRGEKTTVGNATAILPSRG